ncbi:MAG: hypothetical protein IID44_06270 [Planctomycetes bacterium]|nr:hypothetical protein [Planctomycetota bacterium]
MRILATFGLVMALSSVAMAEELKSGLQVGDPVGVIGVEKCAGIEDGIAVGQKLCYR